jgi:hypothetical protein
MILILLETELQTCLGLFFKQWLLVTVKAQNIKKSYEYDIQKWKSLTRSIGFKMCHRNTQIKSPRIFTSVITAIKHIDVVQTFQSSLCHLMINNYLTLYKENRNFVILIKLFHLNQ